jgi:hypothetical protein
MASNTFSLRVCSLTTSLSRRHLARPSPPSIQRECLRICQCLNHQLLKLIPCSTEREIATVQAAGASDVDKAVRAAHTALTSPEWKQMPAAQRGHLMYKLADHIEQQKDIFATSEAWDNGMLLGKLFHM